MSRVVGRYSESIENWKTQSLERRILYAVNLVQSGFDVIWVLPPWVLTSGWALEGGTGEKAYLRRR